MGATYVFGEDGVYKDLTGTYGPGSVWTADHTYIIAGFSYVPDDSTLTLEAGVVVKFDHDYDGDIPTNLPEIEVRGTLVCDGSSNSHVRFTNHSGTARGEFKGVSLNGAGRYEDCVEAFRNRRETFDSQADSLRNEKALILAELALDDEQQVCSVDGGDPALSRLHGDIDRLDALIDDALTRELRANVPSTFAISSIYPNPFNGQTVIAFNLDQKGLIDAAVFDLTGRRMGSLAEGVFEAGRHSLTWNAETAPAGVYFVRISGPSGAITSRMTLVK